MVTTVTSTKDVVTALPKHTGTGGGPGSHGNGKRGGGGGGGGDRHGDNSKDEFSPERYRIGMLVALASVVMLFAALSSAYVVRAGFANDWQPIRLPSLLWLSTVFLIASSFTFSHARRSLKNGLVDAHRRMIFVTLLLGLGFLVAQLLSWRQLVASGVYLSSNPHSSFFYLLTGMHGLHLLGGIAGLCYLWLRSKANEIVDDRSRVRRQTATDVVGIYWHFMDGLWIYLFLLLFLWR